MVGLYCSELAQLRPQIVPWSTLCRADWVHNDLVLTRRSWCYVPGLREATRQRASIRGVCMIDRPGQEQAIAGRPAHDHWTNASSSGCTQPTICLPLSINSSHADSRTERFFSGDISGPNPLWREPAHFCEAPIKSISERKRARECRISFAIT
jgi:hypothetical protein